MKSFKELIGKTTQEVLLIYVEEIARQYAKIPNEYDLTEENFNELRQHLDYVNSDSRLGDYIISLYETIAEKRSLMFLKLYEAQNHLNLFDKVLMSALIKGSLGTNFTEMKSYLDSMYNSSKKNKNDIYNDIWENRNMQYDAMIDLYNVVLVNEFNLKLYNSCIELISKFLNSQAFNYLKLNVEELSMLRESIKEHISLYRGLVKAVKDISDDKDIDLKTDNRLKNIDYIEHILKKRRLSITATKLAKIEKAIKEYKFNNDFLDSIIS